MGHVTFNFDVVQGSPEWLEARDGKYTGTAAHKLLKYGVIEYCRTSTSAFSGNFHTRRGHILEVEGLSIYETVKKCKVLRPGYVTNSLYPTCLFSPDAVTGCTRQDILLEHKAFSEERHMAIYNAQQPIGEIPTEILAQIYFGMFILEFKKAQLIIYNPDLYDPKQCFKIIDIPYNQNIQNNFKRILRKEPTRAL